MNTNNLNKNLVQNEKKSKNDIKHFSANYDVGLESDCTKLLVQNDEIWWNGEQVGEALKPPKNKYLVFKPYPDKRSPSDARFEILIYKQTQTLMAKIR